MAIKEEMYVIVSARHCDERPYTTPDKAKVAEFLAMKDSSGTSCRYRVFLLSSLPEITSADIQLKFDN